MVLADTLSRSPVTQANPFKREEIENWHVYKMEKENKLFKYLEKINATLHLNVTKRTLNKVRRPTAEDPILQTPTSVIMKGWPSRKEEVMAEIGEYWNFRDEL